MAKQIQLSRGLVAVVDDEDFDTLAKYKWTARGKGYYVYAIRREIVDGKYLPIQMHRQIMGHPAGCMVDHRNRNTLDNRRENLRFATNSQNQANCRRRADAKNRYKGVTCKGSCWRAAITFQGDFCHIGYFLSEEQAAKAYDLKATELFGEFATLNF